MASNDDGNSVGNGDYGAHVDLMMPLVPDYVLDYDLRQDIINDDVPPDFTSIDFTCTSSNGPESVQSACAQKMVRREDTHMKKHLYIEDDEEYDAVRRYISSSLKKLGIPTTLDKEYREKDVDEYMRECMRNEEEEEEEEEEKEIGYASEEDFENGEEMKLLETRRQLLKQQEEMQKILNSQLHSQEAERAREPRTIKDVNEVSQDNLSLTKIGNEYYTPYGLDFIEMLGNRATIKNHCEHLCPENFTDRQESAPPPHCIDST
eukprot:Nk52_evm48s2531 gene=Nk52_evmTU48s2531